MAQQKISSTDIASVANTAITGNIINTQINVPSPNVQVFTSGSGTYTVPTNAKYLTVKMCGGGGGGGGSGTGNQTGGSTGSATTFGSSL